MAPDLDQSFINPELLDILFNNVPIGIAVFDRDLVLKKVNPTWASYIARYTQTPIEKVVPGVHFTEIVPGTEGSSVARYQRALAGEIVSGESVPLESGGIVSYWDTYMAPLVVDGEIIGVVDVTSDATECQSTLTKWSEAAAQLKAIVQAFPDLYFRLSPDGIILDYNAGQTSHLYARPEDFLGKHLMDVMPPDVGRQACEALSQVLETQTLVSVEYSLPWPAGLLTFEARFLPLPGRQVMAIVRDITERKRAEESLREREEELRTHRDRLEETVRQRTLALTTLNRQLETEIMERKHAESALREERNFISAVLDTAGVLVAVFDRTGSIVRFNRACEELTGYRLAEVNSQPFWEILIQPHDAEAVKQGFKNICGGAYPLRVANHWVTKSGQPRLIDWSKTAIVDQNGAVAYVISTGIDITERRAAENALRTSEEKYRVLVESANSIILRMNTRGEVTFINKFAQVFFGYAEEEIIGRNIMGTIMPPVDSAGRDLTALIGNLLTHPENYISSENENMRSTGERVWVAWTNRAIKDDRGRIVEFLCIGMDITEHKRSEEQVLQARNELEQRIDEIKTLFAVQQAIVKRLDPEAILQIVADEARRLTKSQRDLVFLMEGEDLRVAVISGDVGRNVIGYRMPIKQYLAGMAMNSGEPLNIRNVHDDPRINKEIVQLTGITSLLLVPLIAAAGPVGAIAVADKFQGSFDRDDERILALLASSAVIGLENARLYQEEHERRHEAEQRRRVAEGLREILMVLNSERPLQEILEYVIGQACRLLQTDTGTIYRLDNESGTLNLQAVKGLPDEYKNWVMPVGKGVGGSVVLSRRPLVFTNVKTELQGDFDEFSRVSEHNKYTDWVAANYQCLLAVPLTIKNEIYGGLSLYYHESRDFTTEEKDLAMSIADQAALAIENAGLRERAEQAAVAAERSRLARDLHDAVTQTLFSASLIAEVLPKLWDRHQEDGRKRLEELRQLTRGALAEMRTLLLELRPATLVEVGLDELLRQLAEATTGRARVPVDLKVEGQCPLPPDVQISFYRIAQEALNNVAKHSGASQAWVHLRCLTVTDSACRERAEQVELHIRDNGHGFDPALVTPEHLGLGIMRERAESIGARIIIESRIGQGTEVTVAWQDPRQEEET